MFDEAETERFKVLMKETSLLVLNTPDSIHITVREVLAK